MISWGLVPWALQLTRYKWFVLESSSAHYWILETFGSEPATVHRSLGQPGKKENFFKINRLITLKRSRYLLSFKSLSTSKENICRIRRRSQTTFTKFGFFDHLPNLRLHFLWYEFLQKVNFFWPPTTSCKRSL